MHIPYLEMKLIVHFLFSETILINNNKNEDTKSLADINIDKLSQMIPVVKNFIANGMA